MIASVPSIEAVQADEFQRLFYSTVDFRRDVVALFYKPTSYLVWNGNEYHGEKVQTFYKHLPPTRHEVVSFDVHEIPDPSIGQGPKKLLVTVVGRVAFDHSHQGSFSQMFLLEPIDAVGTSYYIRCDTCRFIPD